MVSIPLPLGLVLAGAAGAGAIWAFQRSRQRQRALERDRQRTADELNRRLSELFWLQELSYVLSESIKLERIVEQVVRYAMRFIDARGALVALAGENPDDPLTIAAAEGSLADLRGTTVPANDPGLVARSARGERLELIRNSETGAPLASGSTVESAAAVPLRAHGVVVGSLVVAEPRGGALAPDDVRLLSTVATHAAVALANGRFFDLVRRGKEQWETTFDALSEGLAVVDDAGQVRRANRSLAIMVGHPLPEVIGTHLCHALLGRSHALAQMLDDVRRGERPAPLTERSEVNGRTFRINAALMPGATPNQASVVLVQDVTEQQAMEAQLIQSEKLATVGQLVSGVAHELNNPLTSIAGLSEFLLEQKELGTGDRGHLRVIHEQAERAGRIVRNLLTFARKGPAERSHLDLNDLLQRTLLLMSYDLRLRDVETQLELPDDLPEVVGDRHALQQVVLNLLTNAAQAVGDLPENRPRCIRLETWSDGLVHLRVTDTGTGVPPSLERHLFTPFFTTKEPGHGTGLGLSISYSIVESHGGHLSYERAPQGGASFRIDLPAAPAARPAPVPPSPEPSTPLPPAFAKRAILLVDDDPAVRRLVQALFGREGHTVDVARSAEHALELTADHGYDLILADAQVSAKGKLFVEEMLSQHPDLRSRTLVATGDVRPATEEALERLGLRYVRKPFNLRDLREEAARLWAAGAVS
ncbi:MAG TPA: ATP-binding protein [Gemmatimonadales bacterium]